jgi:hypothetical protein
MPKPPPMLIALRCGWKADADPLGEQFGDGACARDVEAELRLRLAGGDVGVGLRIDVGVDAQRDVRGLTERAGSLVDEIQLALGLDVEGVDARFEREDDLLARLANAGEVDF